MILAGKLGSTITSKIAYTTTHVQPVQDIASSWGSGMSASVVADGSTKGLQMVSADNTNFGYIQPKTAIPVSPGAPTQRISVFRNCWRPVALTGL
jgi:hypothetical protein